MRRLALVAIVAACRAPAAPQVREPTATEVVADAARATVTVAADAGAADAGLPTTVLPCIPSDSPELLASDDGDPVVCWETGCMLVDGGGEPRLVARPPALALPRWRRPVATVRDDGGHLAACNAARCRPLGRKLVAEIEHETRRIDEMIHGGRDDLHPVELEATDDVETVTIDGAPWGVRVDKKLSLLPPGKIQPGEVGLVTAHVVADHLEIEWKACAGPCAVGVIADSLARHYGPTFEAGSSGELFQLDDDRFVVVADTGVFTVIELRTGKIVGSVGVAGFPFVGIARLDGLMFGVLAQSGGYFRVTSVDLSSAPRASNARIVPRC